MRNCTDTPDLSWHLNLLLSPLSATFALASFSLLLPPLLLSQSVSLFLTLCQLYWIKGELSCFVHVLMSVCRSCAASVTQAVCMREPDSVWSNHCNHSHGLQPSLLQQPLPPIPSLSLSFLFFFLLPFPASLFSFCPSLPSFFLHPSLSFFSYNPSINPSILPWPRESAVC